MSHKLNAKVAEAKGWEICPDHDFPEPGPRSVNPPLARLHCEPLPHWSDNDGEAMELLMELVRTEYHGGFTLRISPAHGTFVDVIVIEIFKSSHEVMRGGRTLAEAATRVWLAAHGVKI